MGMIKMIYELIYAIVQTTILVGFLIGRIEDKWHLKGCLYHKLTDRKVIL